MGDTGMVVMADIEGCSIGQIFAKYIDICGLWR